MPIELDATDWRILKELQTDGRMTNIALANRIGLSAPPCLRRVRALEEAGWNVSSAARALGMERTNLHKRIRALGLSRGK